MEGEGIMEWMKIINPIRCSSSEAWESKDETVDEHYSCTIGIAASDPLISPIMNEIEEISKLDQITLDQLEDEIWLIFESMTSIQQKNESMHLEQTITKIEELHKRNERNIPSIFCSLNLNCAKAFRKIVFQLKLIQLGYHGSSEATAGLYLAHHREKFGKYYINSMKNRWPHYPLSYRPSHEENVLNEYMIKITEALSYFTNGRRHKNYELKNISILDLPAFGSKLSYLSKTHTNSPNWPMEVNFAILNKYKYNSTKLSTAFRTYKELIQIWASYMDYILEDKTQQRREIPPDITAIPLNPFNFTKSIQDNTFTFLETYMHSHLTMTDNNKIYSVWRLAAGRVFGTTLDNRIVHDNGLFKSLFLDCSFKDQFMMGGKPLAENCDLFQPTLTSNGLCLSFNAKTPSSIWNDNFIFAKAIEKMGAVKSRKSVNFAGAGAREG